MKGLNEQVADWKQEQILFAAGELFYTKGYYGTSMDDIASALSVGKPMIYSYFPSKMALLAAVCNQTSLLVANLAQTVAETNDNDSVSEQMRTTIYQSSLLIIKGRRLLTVLFREVKNLPESSLDRLKLSDTKFREVMIDILSRGKASGEFHYHADERVIAQCISGMVTWLSTWYQENGPLSAIEVAEEMALTALQMAGHVPKHVTS